MRNLRDFAVLFATVAVAGCGGGGGDSSAVPASPSANSPAPSPVPSTSPAPALPPSLSGYRLLTGTELGISITDVNDKGEVLGVSVDASGFPTAAVWSSAALKKIPQTECMSFTFPCPRAYAINNNSQVLLSVTTRLGWSSSSVWRDGTTTSLGCSSVAAINDVGKVLATDLCEQPNVFGPGIVMIDSGERTIFLNNFTPIGFNSSDLVIGTIPIKDADGKDTPQNRAVRYTGLGGIVPLEDQGFADARPNAINDSGVVAGIVDTQRSSDAIRHPRPSIWHEGARSTLPCPDVDGEALGITNSGVVSGSCWRRNGSTYAVLWNNGVATDLNTLLPASAITAGWALSAAMKVTSKGWVLATGTEGTGNSSGTVILVPQP